MIVVRTDTKREKARWDAKAPEIEMRCKNDAKALSSSRNPNFFVDHRRIANFDQATIAELPLPVSSGRGIWSTLRQNEWELVNRLNNDRLEKWGFGRVLEESDSNQEHRDTLNDEDDDIPM